MVLLKTKLDLIILHTVPRLGDILCVSVTHEWQLCCAILIYHFDYNLLSFTFLYTI